MAEQVLTMSANDSVRTRTGDVALRTINLTKQYGQRLAVNNLNLEVGQREIFGFLGPNGAGKTTTIRMALGLISPTSGNVEILNQNLATRRAHILPRVGALIETPALYLYLSGRNNLRAVGSALGGVPDKRIDAVLDLVGLLGRQKDKVKTYSLGMKQRLGIAMALLQNPDLLILDEPTNGMDPAGIVEMRDLMHRLVAEGKTVFISSHLLAEVQQICTRVAIINQGKLVTESTVAELTQGQGEFRVTVEKPQEALALVKNQPWGRNARMDHGQAFLTRAPEDNGRALNFFLSQSGFVPELLERPTQDLEQVFLNLTNSGSGDIK
ncbi:MAG TPA: ABC transporter ATP-binding protein [Ktedonobacteraceae bacterium]|nr:ABC transporter ATP-binding protein [Ktedonobacteraceae bacterium]